jgi:hypothetical protein
MVWQISKRRYPPMWARKMYLNVCMPARSVYITVRNRCSMYATVRNRCNAHATVRNRCNAHATVRNRCNAYATVRTECLTVLTGYCGCTCVVVPSNNGHSGSFISGIFDKQDTSTTLFWFSFCFCFTCYTIFKIKAPSFFLKSNLVLPCIRVSECGRSEGHSCASDSDDARIHIQ